MVEEALVRIWVRNLKNSIGKNRMAVQEDFNLLFIILFIYIFCGGVVGLNKSPTLEEQALVKKES